MLSSSLSLSLSLLCHFPGLKSSKTFSSSLEEPTKSTPSSSNALTLDSNENNVNERKELKMKERLQCEGKMLKVSDLRDLVEERKDFKYKFSKNRLQIKDGGQ